MKVAQLHKPCYYKAGLMRARSIVYRVYYITSLLFITLLNACDNSSANSTNGLSNKKHSLTNPAIVAIDSNFNDFIEKFSIDSNFQISRIQFPLKIIMYDIDNDRDSIFYKDSSSFDMIDFRKYKSTNQYDQWEQKIVIEKASTFATIEISGMDNGILVDYLFQKINGAWMLIEIDDSSK